ncbi:MAG: TonB-dependent receptor [Rhodospirillales bacterium]|nr:TonB-dependent receptor [Rhodospirillales bacterium]
MSHLRVFAIAIVLMIAHPTFVFAQASLDILTVDATTKAPVGGVPLKLGNSEIGYAATAITDAQGKARLSGLATSGLYVVTVPENQRYRTAQSAPIDLRSLFTSSTVIALSPAGSGLPEEIVVTGRRATSINRVDAEVSGTLTQQDLQELPIEARDLSRSLYRLPGVTQATGFFPEAPNVSINGANSLFTNYEIDGMDNNENFLGGPKFPVPVGFAKDVTVLTSNYSVEYGRTGNGVVNVTSKSGGNDLHGEIFYVTRPGAGIDGSSPFPQRDLSGNTVGEDFSRQQGGFAVGGALVQDKTFFFIDAEVTIDSKDNQLSVPELGIDQKIPGQNQFIYGSGKIDQLWSDDWKSTLRFNLGAVSIDRQGGGVQGGIIFPSAADSEDRTSMLIALQNTYNGDNFTYEGNVQYGLFDWNYSNPKVVGPQVTIDDPTGQTLGVIGNDGSVFHSRENSWQVQQKFTTQLGRHQIKAGADLMLSEFNLLGGGNVDGNYTVRLTNQQLAQIRALNRGTALSINDIPSNAQVLNDSVEIRPDSFGKRQDLVALYIEDQYEAAPNLNLTAGLRWDYDNLSQGGASSPQLGNVAPRASVNYQPDESSSLHAGAGLFYEKIPYTVYSDALQQSSISPGFRQQIQQLINLGRLPANTNIDRVTFNGNLQVNPQNVVYLQGPTGASVPNLRDTTFSNQLRILNPSGFNNPYTMQVSAGYDVELSDNLVLSTNAVFARGHNLVRLIDVNAPVPYSIAPAALVGKTPEQIAALVRTTALANATRPVQPVVGGAQGIIMSDTGGSSDYKALTISLVKKRGSDWYGYRLSYTLSRDENDTDDINFMAQDANNFSTEFGPSLNDRTHVINAIAYLYPIEGLTMTIASAIQSGQPYNRVPDATLFGTTDLNGDGQSFGAAYVGNSDRFPGSGRNNGRLPWSIVFDLSVLYTIPVERGQIELRADIFNLFNRTNLSGYSNAATASNQIQLGNQRGILIHDAGPPRQFQFGIRYIF